MFWFVLYAVNWSLAYYKKSVFATHAVPSDLGKVNEQLIFGQQSKEYAAKVSAQLAVISPYCTADDGFFKKTSVQLQH